MNNTQKKNRRLILGIFAMGIIPVMLAWYLAKHQNLLALGTTNYGMLITPPVTIDYHELSASDLTSMQKMQELPGRWLLVHVLPNPVCNAACLQAILATKQLRLMLNKDLLRTRRITITYQPFAQDIIKQLQLKEALLPRLLVKGDNEDENNHNNQLYKQLLEPGVPVDATLVDQLLGQENRESALTPDLIQTNASEGFKKKLASIQKGDIPDGMLFIMDPLGNLMMQYPPGFDPYKVKQDLSQLLRASQIG